MNKNDFFRTPIWYPSLAGNTFLTTFVKLAPDEVQALIEGAQKGPVVNRVIERLRHSMNTILGNCFVSVDSAAPTDTERFAAKRGAVHSPESAWRFLAESAKVRQAATTGQVEYICVRPFRRMNQTREFRLFIRNGELVAMSQYWLIRHFRRLEGVKQDYWKQAKKFVESIRWALPVDTLVMDIYCTSDSNILIVDLNPWGECDPKLLRSWDRDWSEPAGIILMPAPTTISGDVNVSF